jgi:hypothetical protein
MVKVEVLCDSIVYRGRYYEKARDTKKRVPNSPRQALGPIIDEFPEAEALLHEKRGNLRIVREVLPAAVGAKIPDGSAVAGKSDKEKGDRDNKHRGDK